MAGKLVAENLKIVREKISLAAARAGRDASEIELIAVSKTKPIELINEAHSAGQKAFAENYVQELLPKIEANNKVDWHFIGRLQTNKVKQLVGKVALIHSVDRLKLAAEIAKVAENKKIQQDILLQVHIGGEDTKGGATPAELAGFLQEAASLNGVRIRGLMSLPPLSEDESIARGYFREVRQLFDQAKAQFEKSSNGKFFNILSVGTSSDFEWAILEGATHVRIGTAIFGERS